MKNKEEKRIYTYEELEEFCKKNNRLPQNKNNFLEYIKMSLGLRN